MDIRAKLIHAVTQHDIKQSTRRGYNRYALAQYFAAVDSAMCDMEDGMSAENALANNFTDRLLDVCLKAIL